MYSYLTYICYSYIYVTYMQHICVFGKGCTTHEVTESRKQLLLDFSVTIRSVLPTRSQRAEML